MARRTSDEAMAVPMIPKVFHQIWINDTDPTFPREYVGYRDSWLRHHPDWEYRLWNLDDIDFELSHRHLIDSAPNYAQKADLLRYQILLHHGGVYIDTDFECLRPIDDILAGVRNFSCSENGTTISIGILGAELGSPYLQRILDSLPASVGRDNTSVETGPRFVTKVLIRGGMASDFTIFPSAWFYPYGMHEPERRSGPFPDAYAVHHWAHSWDSAAERRFTTRARRRLARVVAAARGG